MIVAKEARGDTMACYLTNIEKATLDNVKFRRVLFTGPHTQLVVMALKPGEDIGLETHDDVDQFIRVEAGHGTALLDGKEHVLEDGSAVVIPAGTKHNIINSSRTEPLKLYTIYSPPEHPDGTMHDTKADAEAYEREHHG
jgi:mannose-6-phosphate isomerase-like protein (cupin superfamily)